jgi:hypothetical protein
MNDMDEESVYMNEEPGLMDQDEHQMLSPIKPNSHKSINYNDRLLDTTEYSDNESAFKILEILCPTSDDGVNTITNDQFLDSFYSFPYVFVIVLKCMWIQENAEIYWTRLNDYFKARANQHPLRPIIISIESQSTSKNLIFYKNANESYFNRFNWDLNPQNFCFQKLMMKMRSGEWGFYGGEILNSLINDLNSFDNLKLIDQALQANDILCIRFLQLFDPNLRDQNSEGKKPLEYAAQYCNIDGFLAVFGLLFEFTSNAYHDLMNRSVQNILNLDYSNG